MIARVIAVVLLLALMVVAADVALPRSQANAQPTGGAEVRLGARAYGAGSVSVGLQYRVDGTWRSVTPSRNILTRSASADRWHATSAVEIEVVQARAEIGVLNRAWSDFAGPEQFTITFGDTRYRARCGRLVLSLSDEGLEMQTGSRNCEDVITVEPPQLADPTDVGAQVVRVVARRLSPGGIELGLQRLVGGRWETMRQPTRPVLTGLSRTNWLFTSVLELPTLPAHVFGELRRGASISARDGEFDVEVDGRVYRTRCGALALGILTEHILVDTAAEQCHGSAPLLTICPTSNCDVQQNAVYAWESRQIGASLEQIEVTRSEAQAVVNAIFADFLPRGRAPAVSFSSEQSYGHAGRNEIVLGTNVRNLGAVVHELGHVLVDLTTLREAGHGGAFTAMLLHLWERYFPIADLEAARDDARRNSIEIASRPPARARFGEARRAIGELFCDRLHNRSWPELCNAASGAMSERADQEVAGSYTGSGGEDNAWWGAYVDDESGEFRSFVALDTAIAQTGSEARLSVQCEEDRLEVHVYWDVGQDLDWTILYRLNGGLVQSEEWVSGWGTWGDTEYKWTGLEDAAELVAELAWAAQLSGTFTVQSQARDNQSEIYTAIFDLDGLFQTPVQPNLVRCGR